MSANDTADGHGATSASASSMNVQEMIARYRQLNELFAAQIDSCQNVTRKSMELLDTAQGANAQLLAQHHLLKTVSAVVKNRDADLSRPPQPQTDSQSQQESIALQRILPLSAKAAPSPAQPRQQPHALQQPGIQSGKGQAAFQARQQPNVLQRPGIQLPKAQGAHRPGFPGPCQQPHAQQGPRHHSPQGRIHPQAHQQPRQMPPLSYADIEPPVDLEHVIFELASLGGPQALSRMLRDVFASDTHNPDDSAWEDCD